MSRACLLFTDLSTHHLSDSRQAAHGMCSGSRGLIGPGEHSLSCACTDRLLVCSLVRLVWSAIQTYSGVSMFSWNFFSAGPVPRLLSTCSDATAFTHNPVHRWIIINTVAEKLDMHLQSVTAWVLSIRPFLFPSLLDHSALASPLDSDLSVPAWWAPRAIPDVVLTLQTFGPTYVEFSWWTHICVHTRFFLWNQSLPCPYLKSSCKTWDTSKLTTLSVYDSSGSHVGIFELVLFYKPG